MRKNRLPPVVLLSLMTSLALVVSLAQAPGASSRRGRPSSGLSYLFLRSVDEFGHYNLYRQVGAGVQLLATQVAGAAASADGTILISRTNPPSSPPIVCDLYRLVLAPDRDPYARVPERLVKTWSSIAGLVDRSQGLCPIRPDGRGGVLFLASTDYKKRCTWDLSRAGSLTRIADGVAMSATRGGRLIAMSSGDNVSYVLPRGEAGRRGRVRIPGRYGGVEISPGGSRLVMSDTQNGVDELFVATLGPGHRISGKPRLLWRARKDFAFRDFGFSDERTLHFVVVNARSWGAAGRNGTLYSLAVSGGKPRVLAHNASLLVEPR